MSTGTSAFRQEVEAEWPSLTAELREFVNCSPTGNLGHAIMEHVYGQPTGIERRAQDVVRFIARRTGYGH
jgi:hypothetical protein